MLPHARAYLLFQSTTRIVPLRGALALTEALAGHAEAVPEAIAFRYRTTPRDAAMDERAERRRMA